MRKKIAFVIGGTIAALIIAAGFTVVYSPAAALPATPTQQADPAPEVHSMPVLPEWAQGQMWIIYPEGFQCAGTEGCPNDYLTIGGEVGPVLPEGVEIYDPSKHDCVIVQPAGVTC